MTQPIDLETEITRLKSRVADLERFQQAHLGPEQGTAGGDYPHPNIKLASAVFGGGGFRLADEGIQFAFADLLSSEKARGVFWVPGHFEDDPNTANEFAAIVGLQTGFVDQWQATYTIDAANTRYGSFIVQEDSPQLTVTGLFAADGTGSPLLLASIYLELDNINDTAVVKVDVPLRLDSATADPTNSTGDGEILYRSDTDKFRARVNGAWVNLLTSADSVGNLSLTWEWQTGGNFNFTTGDMIYYTGTGGDTATMTSFDTGHYAVVKNRGTGNLTVSGTIDGGASVVLAPYDSVTLFGIGGDTAVII